MILVHMKADRVVCKMNKDHLIFKHLSELVNILVDKNTTTDEEIEKEIKKYIDSTFKIKDDMSTKVIHYLERYLTI